MTRSVAVLLCFVLAAAAAAPAIAAGEDYSVPGGRVFTQAAGHGSVNAGHLVSDADGIPFWTAFQALGGPHAVGYPVSQRFVWQGFVVQVMQKLVFQWQPGTSEVVFINIFDEMSRSGLDEKLAKLLIPREQTFPEESLSWGEIIARRQALLSNSPKLRDAYFGRADPLRWFGLPTSPVISFGDVTAIRTQRAVLQLWHVDTPWARADEVTVANGGDLAKKLGLFPSYALEPQSAVPQPAAIQATGDALVDKINTFRADIGLPSLKAHPALMQAAQAHADYYVANRNDPNSGSLHTEVPGKPGYTGRTIGQRSRAAGYTLGWVDETFGFLPPAGTLEWALSTVFHRYMFVHPSAVDVGYGWAFADGTQAAVFNVGLSPQHTAPVPLPSVVPRDGASGVPWAWDGAEWPDPAPGIERPLGPPITLIFGLGDRIEWGAATVSQAGKSQVALARSTSAWRRALALIPHAPLARSSRYHVRVEGVRNGTPFAIETHFTTRS